MVRLQIDKLGKKYGTRQVLIDLSWETEAPVIGIAGPNGSGKSTLLQCLSGLLKPASGRVVWFLEGKEHLPAEMHTRLGFTAPYVELYEAMTIRENLLFLWQLNRSRKQNHKEEIPRLLQRFQADRIADKPYGELSTGQRQRAKLAACCLHDPQVLCLDEPGSNLDAAGREVVTDLIRDFESSGRMVLIASNQPDELEMCHEMIHLDQKVS